MRELHDRATPASLQPEVRLDVEQDIADFRKRVSAMRDERASVWGDITIELLPPSSAEDGNESQRPTAAEAERKARDERRRIATASSGGPLKRVESL